MSETAKSKSQLEASSAKKNPGSSRSDIESGYAGSHVSSSTLGSSGAQSNPNTKQYSTADSDVKCEDILCLIKLQKNKNVFLEPDLAVLEQVLSSCHQDRLCVIAVTGSHRSKKSILFSEIIDGLKTLESKSNQKLIKDRKVHQGFKIKTDQEIVKHGIWICNRAFRVMSAGKKLSVLLVYVEGIDDKISKSLEIESLLALSLLISSTLIFNTISDLSPTQFSWISSLLGDGDMENFPKLSFVIQNWTDISSHSYGNVNGKEYIRGVAQQYFSKGRARLKHHDCFMMPHFGGERKKGSQPSSEFAHYMQKYIDSILNYKGLEIKRIFRNKISAGEFRFFFVKYAELININHASLGNGRIWSFLEQVSEEWKIMNGVRTYELHFKTFSETEATKAAIDSFSTFVLPTSKEAVMKKKLLKELHQSYRYLKDRTDILSNQEETMLELELEHQSDTSCRLQNREEAHVEVEYGNQPMGADYLPASNASLFINPNTVTATGIGQPDSVKNQMVEEKFAEMDIRDEEVLKPLSESGQWHNATQHPSYHKQVTSKPVYGGHSDFCWKLGPESQKTQYEGQNVKSRFSGENKSSDYICFKQASGTQKRILSRLDNISPINTTQREKVEILLSDLHRKTNVQNDVSSPETLKDDLCMGIDLGTSYCCATVYQEGSLEKLRMNHGEYTTPSYVCISKDGNETVGTLAKNQAYKHPENTFFNMKRILEKQNGTTMFCKNMEFLPFGVIETTNDQHILADGNQYSVRHIVSILLKYLKEQAEEYMNTNITKAVITIPACFTDHQRRATWEAGEMAGLNVLGLLTDSTAAALTFRQKWFREGTSSKLLVYDFGGGTFDACVFYVSETKIKVLGAAGDSNLGGEDIDEKLMQYCIEKFYEQTETTNLDENFYENQEVKQHLNQLRRECENVKKEVAAKKEFSSSRKVHVERFASGRDLTVEVSRKVLDELNMPLYQQTLQIMDQALKGAGLSSYDEIDEIVLVGGSARIKTIEELLIKHTGKPLLNHLKTDDAVAYGAGVYAACLRKDSLPFEFGEIEEITHWSYGIQLPDKSMDVLIKMGTKVPVSHTEVYNTHKDNQTGVSIAVYQEDGNVFGRKVFLGTICLNGIPPRPAGMESIDVTMRVDLNGMLCVEAKCRSINKTEFLKNPQEFSKPGSKKSKTASESINSCLESVQKLVKDDSIDHFVENENYNVAESDQIPCDFKEWIGRGAYNTHVYKGFYKNSRVAVKKFQVDSKYTSSLNKTILFFNFKNFPNLLKYYSVTMYQGNIFLTSELCDMNLDAYLETHQNESKEKMFMCEQILKGLAFLHTKSIPHGGLRPANILVITDCKFASNMEKYPLLKVSDYNMSKFMPFRWREVAKSSLAREVTEWFPAEILQTLQTLAAIPAQKWNFRKTNVDTTEASDVFTLGCIFFHVLSAGKLHLFGKKFRREANIISGNRIVINREIYDVSLWPLIYIIYIMTNCEAKKRPSLNSRLWSSVFWDEKIVIEFLQKVVTNLTKHLTKQEVEVQSLLQGFSTFGIMTSAGHQILTLEDLVAKIIRITESGIHDNDSKFVTLLIWEAFKKNLSLKKFYTKTSVCDIESVHSVFDHLSKVKNANEEKHLKESFQDGSNATNLQNIPQEEKRLGHDIMLEQDSEADSLNPSRSNQNTETFNLLKEKVENSLGLSSDVIENRKTTITTLVNSNEDLLFLKNANGDTVLHLPFIHIDIIIDLIKLGSSVYEKNNKGKTLLHVCPSYLSAVEYHKLVMLLVRRNNASAFKVQTILGKVPLYYAVRKFDVLKSTLSLLRSANQNNAIMSPSVILDIIEEARKRKRSHDFITHLKMTFCNQ